MAIHSSLSKALMLLLSVFLVVSLLGVNAGTTFAAAEDHPPVQSPKNHVFYSVTYQKVYANPNDKTEEAALLYALIVLHPSLQTIKYVQEALIVLGLWQSFRTLMKREEVARKAQGYYLIEKKVYKAKKTTKSYWGYSQTFVYSSALNEKIKGKTLTIGKTSY